MLVRVDTTLTRTFKLRGDAKKLLTERAPQVIFAGPAGTGKSFGCLVKIHLMCLLNPGAKALIVRKTHKSLTSTGLVTFREKVANEAIASKLCRWYGGSAERPAQYIYANGLGGSDGSTIVVGGLDQPDKIMSSDYDVIFVQEGTDCTPDDIEKLTTRLRNGKVSFQQLIIDCNPQQPTHHIKKRADEGKAVMLYGRHEDNPDLFDDDGAITERGIAYLSVLDSLSGVRKERLRWGKWAAAEGLIYAEWNPAVHLLEPRPRGLPKDWRRIWAVDFGYVHPFVWQQWAVDEDGRLYLEREIHMTGRLVEDHAKRILQEVTVQTGTNKGKWKYPRPSAILCDHDAEDRATLERHLGMGTTPAKKTVSDGIQAMQARLRVQPDGRPRMFVLRDSLAEIDTEAAASGKPTCFADEIEGYVWMPSPDGRPAKDAPVKENDDSMDPARYVVAYHDLQPRTRVRWIN